MEEVSRRPKSGTRVPIQRRACLFPDGGKAAQCHGCSKCRCGGRHCHISGRSEEVPREVDVVHVVVECWKLCGVLICTNVRNRIPLLHL